MTMSGASQQGEWTRLASLSEHEREAYLEEYYTELAGLPEEERSGHLEAMISQVYSLPEDEIVALTRSRLKAWTRMEPEAARKVAGSYEAVMSTMPGSIAWQRVSVVRSAAKALSPEEQAAIRSLNPHVLPPDPAMGPASSTHKSQAQAAARTVRSPWWAFWKRG